MRECQTREWRNYETAWNKEKSRKGKKEIKEAAARLPASRPWYPLRFINFSQRQCQSHGGFPAAGAPGDPRLLSGLLRSGI